MMKPEVLERRCLEMRRKMAGEPKQQNPSVIDGAGKSEITFNLAEAAVKLGVSYSSARRLLQNEPGVRRYSTGTQGPVYPGSKLKRFQRVRLTWVIPESAIHNIVSRMNGLTAWLLRQRVVRPQRLHLRFQFLLPQLVEAGVVLPHGVDIIADEIGDHLDRFVFQIKVSDK
jgi:hypothetical protein